MNQTISQSSYLVISQVNQGPILYRVEIDADESQVLS